MNKKLARNFGYVVAALSLSSFAIGVACADIQMDPFTQKNGTAGGCIGAYTGYAKMTNSSNGTLWITPTNKNVVSGTFTDASGFGAPYASIATLTSYTNFTPVCGGSNSITFRATYGTKYELTLYVTSPTPPPATNQPLTLQITWQTNSASNN